MGPTMNEEQRIMLEAEFAQQRLNIGFGELRGDKSPGPDEYRNHLEDACEMCRKKSYRWSNLNSSGQAKYKR
ncbi:hypothetical protein HAX54_014355, partial [Datura stramonium]|nr:hypothetical protein [Datura stramonium]